MRKLSRENVGMGYEKQKQSELSTYEFPRWVRRRNLRVHMRGNLPTSTLPQVFCALQWRVRLVACGPVLPRLNMSESRESLMMTVLSFQLCGHIMFILMSCDT